VAAQEEVPRSRASRLNEVDDLVRSAREAVAPDHPYRSALHDALDGLRGRLRLAHAGCERVDDDAWADHVTRLDRGLDELAIEMRRVAEPSPVGQAVDEAIYIRATHLEIDSWMLRLDHARGESDAHAARELAAEANRNLAGLGRAK